ncbi:hypothetical protein [Deinococcus radiotolerans]|uniref:Uncharacterized protein n=1 Tax=Deinococcus radiotolerans TaxID=1309407 RepID=A0ABQ2FL80_9DEIO|nr:hypothetical protein [Deinococcus radiotolerans]GGL05117.1 hypothetical protein GCM10010844_24860 [Deinococcus radiotolerans]
MNTTPTPLRPTYVKPQLQPLGKWAQVTLIQSVPIGPGSLFNPGSNSR